VVIRLDMVWRGDEEVRGDKRRMEKNKEDKKVKR
jgi:hypothetical protein